MADRFYREKEDDAGFSVDVNRADRVITIQGVRYSFDLFDQLGFGPIGRMLRIERRDDGTVTLRHIIPESPTGE